jgi:hypothetical protein
MSTVASKINKNDKKVNKSPLLAILDEGSPKKFP